VVVDSVVRGREFNELNEADESEEGARNRKMGCGFADNPESARVAAKNLTVELELAREARICGPTSVVETLECENRRLEAETLGEVEDGIEKFERCSHIICKNQAHQSLRVYDDGKIRSVLLEFVCKSRLQQGKDPFSVIA
jgi:hypothetical protein